MSGIFQLKMRKISLGLLMLGFTALLSGCSLPSFQQANSGIRVTTNPGSVVFMDDQQVGTTPYENKKLNPGEISLRLVPQATAGGALATWEGKLRLTPGIQTIIDRDFAETLAQSSGYSLSFDRIGGKEAAMSIISTPDAAGVKVDGNSQGFTPVVLDSVGEGEHRILLTAPGYEDKLVTAKATNGHRLVVTVQLSQLPQPTASASATTPGLPVLGQTSPTPKASPEPKTTPAVSLPPKPYIQVLNTPTGWLRVRTDPSSAATEAAKVNPGQAFPFKDTSADGNWYQIEYKPGDFGWVSAQYAKKVE